MAAAVDAVRIKHNKMNVAIIIGIIMWSAGCQAAAFCMRRYGKNFIIRNIMICCPGSIVRIFMIAWYRENNMVIKNIIVVNIKEIKGVLGFGTCVIGIITEHYHHFRIIVTGF